jgi:hypothetical protein
MIRYIKSSAAVLGLALVMASCAKKDGYSMGNLVAPTDVAVTATIAGVDGTHPNGDGTGTVTFAVTGKNVLSYKIDYDASNGINLEFLANGTGTTRYTALGTNTYHVTVVAYGSGAAATTITKDVTVLSVFIPDAALVTNLVGSTATGKAWAVDKDATGHFGVGPWSDGTPASQSPVWYAAAPNEKAGCCNCFYSASFTFAQTAPGVYSLKVLSPDGAFTKTGDLAGGLPGIPGTGAEGCYPYAGGTSAFTFAPAGSAALNATQSTKTSIKLGGNNTYIGYGAQLKEYEIISISATNMYLRVQGTETGNAWYLKLKAI